MESITRCAAALSLLLACGAAGAQMDLDRAKDALNEQPANIESALGGLSAAKILEKEAEFVDAPAEAEMPGLMPGDKAPELNVATFVKGTPISEFEQGTAYLVDFWATWCGPCIRAMPHLSEMQDTFGDDNFRVVAVSIWEQPEGDELIDHVSEFVESRDDVMRYTVAVDNNGAMAESWMGESGQQGIPTAMLVGRDGNIAWIGYGNDPAMDEAVKSVVAGEWDTAQAREDRMASIKEEHEANSFRPWYERFIELANSGERTRAAQVAGALLVEGKLTDPQAMNAMAWTIVENEGWDAASLTVAKSLATRALEKLDWDNAAVLDTLAWAEHRLGNHKEAVRVQEMAVDKAGNEQEKSALSESLEVFKKAAG